MTNRLIILMPSHADGPGLWGRVNGAKVIAHGRDAPPADISAEVIAVLAGQSVRLYPHELPVSSKRDRLRAAGFSIEDMVAQRLDHMHIALDDNRIGVMSKTDLQDALDQLSDAGLKPTQAIADFDALSGIEGDIEMLDRVVSTGELGHTVDLDWSETTTPQTFSDEKLLSAIGVQLEKGEVLNLLQNEFSIKSGLGLEWRRFAGLGALAASLAIAGLVWQGLEARAMKLRAADIKTRTAQLYSEATGKAAPTNPALAATRALKAGGQDSFEFLHLSQILFNGVEKIDGLSVDQLRYQQTRHELQLRLIYPSFESASEFEAAVKSAGGQLITGGVREQSGEFVGEAVLREGRS